MTQNDHRFANCVETLHRRPSRETIRINFVTTARPAFWVDTILLSYFRCWRRKQPATAVASTTLLNSSTIPHPGVHDQWNIILSLITFSAQGITVLISKLTTIVAKTLIKTFISPFFCIGQISELQHCVSSSGNFINQIPGHHASSSSPQQPVLISLQRTAVQTLALYSFRFYTATCNATFFIHPGATYCTYLAVGRNRHPVLYFLSTST